ncbi:hypothetical protein Tco_0445069, partial [Tanacetum coccineum]
MAGSDDEIPPPHTVSTIKLPILKKGKYDIWAMKMEHFLIHTDYPIWEVIQKGNGHVSVSTDTNEVIKVLPPKTAEEFLARERERKVRTTLLMALPEDHLAKFHKMIDAKDIQLQVDLQAEVERERQREEEASKAAIAEMYDEVQAGIDANALAVQRSAEIRSRQPTKSQLRNLMMTYLKNMGGYKRSRLKAKTFAEIQGLYERQKRVIDDFKPMDSDDAIKDSKEAAGVHKQKVLKEPNSTKVEIKQEGHEESIRKRPGRKLKMKATKKSKR